MLPMRAFRAVRARVLPQREPPPQRIRWHNRVVGYAFILVTDRYPPFSMSQRDTAPPAPERPPPRLRNCRPPTKAALTGADPTPKRSVTRRNGYRDC